MVSGPDLGGGFLWQLTEDPDGAASRFTYHAQYGGMDAGGPPSGPPTPFGFELAPSMCAVGGRECYHREFRLPGNAAPSVRQTYNRCRFVMAPMMAQAYGGVITDVAPALGEILDRVPLGPAETTPTWYVGGSAAAWLQGTPLDPRDLDLGGTFEGVQTLAQGLTEYLIEPLASTDWPKAGRRRAARAFVGTLREGVRVEWGLGEDGGRPLGSEREWGGRDRGDPVLRWVEWEGRRLPVSAREYSILRAAERGDRDRLRRLVPSAGGPELDRELLDDLLADATVPDRELRFLRELAGTPG